MGEKTTPDKYIGGEIERMQNKGIKKLMLINEQVMKGKKM